MCQVFLITAIFPLLVVTMSLRLEEERVERDDKQGFGELARSQVRQTHGSLMRIRFCLKARVQMCAQIDLLWGTISKREVWLPTLFIFLWQATPSSETAFFYFLTGDPTSTPGIGISPEQLGRVKAGSSVASLLGIWAYRRFLQDVPIKQTLFWCAIASVPIGLTQLLLITHANRALGEPAQCQDLRRSFWLGSCTTQSLLRMVHIRRSLRLLVYIW